MTTDPAKRLTARLDDLTARVHRALLRDGLGRTAATLAGAVVAAVAFDLLLHPPAAVRGLLLTGLLTATAWVAWRRLLSPMLHGPGRREVALRLERSVPELSDRLAAASEFSERPPADTEVGARLAELAVAEAEDRLSRADLTHTVADRRAWASLAVGAAAVAAVAVAAVVSPAVRVALSRTLWPAPEDGPAGVGVASAAGLPAGPSISLPAVAEASVEIRYPEYTGLPAATFDRRDGTVTAVVGSSATLRVRADRPAASAAIRFPDGRETAMKSDADGRFSVELPMSEGEQRLAVVLKSVDGQVGDLTYGEPATIAIRGVADALPRVRVESPARRDVEVLPAATVALKLSAEDDFGFRDPHGIASVRLVGRVVRGAGADSKEAPAEFALDLLAEGEKTRGSAEHSRPAPGRAELRLSRAWDLSALRLSAGDVVEWRVAVRDSAWTRGPAGTPAPLHEPVASDPPASPRRLRVLSEEEFTALLLRDFAESQRALAAAVAEQRRLHTRTEPAAERLADPRSAGLTAADRAGLAEVSAEQAGVASAVASARRQIEEVRRRLAANRSRDERGKAVCAETVAALDRLSAEDLPAVAEALRAAADAGEGDRAAQSAAVARTREAQSAAARRLADIVERMRAWGGLASLQARLADLGEAQRRLSAETAAAAADPSSLGKAPAELPPEARDRNARLAERQAELAAQAAKVVEDLERMAGAGGEGAAAAASSSPDSSDRARRAADAAKGGDVAGKLAQAGKDIAANRAGSAAEPQKDAAEALDRAAQALDGRGPDGDTRDERELDTLAKKIDAGLEAVRALVRRQERHAADIRAAMTERAPDAVRCAAVGVDQDRTRRNAEAVAAELRDLKDPEAAQAEPEVARAAARMRPVVREMSAAHPSAAVDDAARALEHLKQAEKVLAEAAAKKRRERQDRKAAQLAAEIRKVRDAQETLRAEVAAMAKRLAGASSSPGRRDLVQIAEAARRQETLKADAEKLREALGKTVVFGWVLEQAGRRMEAAARRLADRKADQPVAVAQADAVRRLDQLIESLRPDTDKLRDKPIHDSAGGNGGGGGGGGAGKPVPPIAELKALRAMQLELNRRVRQLDQRIADKSSLDPADAEAVRELARTQEALTGMARRMAEELKRNDPHGDASDSESAAEAAEGAGAGGNGDVLAPFRRFLEPDGGKAKAAPGDESPKERTILMRELRERLRKRKTQLEARDLLKPVGPGDTVGKLMREMEDAGELIGAELHTGRETQKRQAEAVAALDRLIEEALQRGRDDGQDDGSAGSAGPPRRRPPPPPGR
jgi:hypothetical protein